MRTPKYQDNWPQERILQVAYKKGYFSVSLKYRHEWMQKRVMKLVRQGLLERKGKIIAGCLHYYLTGKGQGLTTLKNNKHNMKTQLDTTTIKPLKNHMTQQTAYIVDDYPYGFTLRCKIRYWLEYNAKKGYRLVSQTTDPRKDFEYWNTPKKSTYSYFAFMYLDENDHVKWYQFSAYDSLESVKQNRELYKDFLDDTTLKGVDKYIELKEKYIAAMAKKREMLKTQEGITI